MMFRSKTCCVPVGAGGRGRRKGFTLPEAVAALVILGFFSSSVLVVINRCMAWAGDSAVRMHAFELARDNMEKLLSSNSVKESSESGDSEKYPGIKWQTDVETFYEPITSRMWVRAICTTEYEDAEGELQKVELEHWLTNLSKEQLLEIAEREEREKAILAGQIIETIEEAAAYAGVDVETVEQWIDNGMVTLEDGSFAKPNLDIFADNNGNPPAEQIQAQVQSEAELVQQQTEQQQQQDTTDNSDADMTQEEWLNSRDPVTGLTYGEIEQMGDAEYWKRVMVILKEKMK